MEEVATMTETATTTEDTDGYINLYRRVPSHAALPV